MPLKNSIKMDDSHKLQLRKEEMKQYGYQVIDAIVASARDKKWIYL